MQRYIIVGSDSSHLSVRVLGTADTVELARNIACKHEVAGVDLVTVIDTVVRYVVYDNNKLAQFPQTNVHHSWDNCTFWSLQAAREYATSWLGTLYSLPPNWDGTVYEYNGYDTIEIKKEIV